MSDVVAVALITSISTASVAIAAGLFGYWLERIRSRGETERLEKRLKAEDRRLRVNAIREGRVRAVERLQSWIQRQVILGADLSVLIAFAPTSPFDVTKLIDERLKVLQAMPPEEASINSVLSQFSDSAIIAGVRSLQDQAKELTEAINSPEIKAAASQGRQDQLVHLWEPVLEKQTGLDESIAKLNGRLETYVLGDDPAS